MWTRETELLVADRNVCLIFRNMFCCFSAAKIARCALTSSGEGDRTDWEARVAM